MSANRVRAALESEVHERADRLRECVEDQWFDRKSARIKPKDLGPAFVGFANAEGGTLVIGLEDDLSDLDALLREWQQVAADFTAPPVHARVSAVEYLGDDGSRWFGLVDIEASEQVHETQGGQCYLRIGDETRKLSFTQRQELNFDKGQSSYDGQPARGAVFEDLDAGALEAYRSATGTTLPTADLLTNRGLLTRKGEVTHAAILLFGRTPQAFLANSDVRLIRYRGNDRGQGTGLAVDADSDIRVEGTLPVVIDRAVRILADWVPARRALGEAGRFERVPVIPQDVWIEAVVNAVVHRSYSLSGDHVRVEVFDNRIEVTSPGRLPGLVRLDDPEKVARFSRNPRIARVLFDLRLVRELGEGIRRMYGEMRRTGLVDPEYRQTAGSVTVILRTDSRLPRSILERLPRGATDALQVLRSADRPLGTGDVEDALGLTRPTVIRILKALRAEGLVVWSGKSSRDPRATWTAAD